MWDYFALTRDHDEHLELHATFAWTLFEKALTSQPCAGRQVRLFGCYDEYPGGTSSHPGNGIPPMSQRKMALRNNGFWAPSAPTTTTPTSSPRVTNFINAFAAPLRQGRAGRHGQTPESGSCPWAGRAVGEWPTWPTTGHRRLGRYPDLMRPDAPSVTLINAFDSAPSTHPAGVRDRPRPAP
ncbi:hypothetical protein GCM10020220_016830 [Nonomuraea rubra]